MGEALIRKGGGSLPFGENNAVRFFFEQELSVGRPTELRVYGTPFMVMFAESVYTRAGVLCEDPSDPAEVLFGRDTVTITRSRVNPGTMTADVAVYYKP